MTAMHVHQPTEYPSFKVGEGLTRAQEGDGLVDLPLESYSTEWKRGSEREGLHQQVDSQTQASSSMHFKMGSTYA